MKREYDGYITQAEVQGVKCLIFNFDAGGNARVESLFEEFCYHPRVKLRAYREAIASAEAAYEKARAPAEAAYREAIASAWEAYEKAIASAWEIYEKARAPAEAAYREARASAWEAYEKARAPALWQVISEYGLYADYRLWR